MRSVISRDGGTPIEAAVVVEHMPAEHRASHRTARNWGQYPANGAILVLMNPDEADEHCAADEYDRIVRDASVHDHCSLPEFDAVSS